MPEYIVQVGVNFRKNGVWPSLYDVVRSWLRLKTPIDCIPHPYWIYKEHLEMLWIFFLNWGMAKSECCCKVMVEAPNPQRLYPPTMAYICEVF